MTVGHAARARRVQEVREQLALVPSCVEPDALGLLRDVLQVTPARIRVLAIARFLSRSQAFTMLQESGPRWPGICLSLVEAMAAVRPTSHVGNLPYSPWELERRSAVSLGRALGHLWTAAQTGRFGVASCFAAVLHGLDAEREFVWETTHPGSPLMARRGLPEEDWELLAELKQFEADSECQAVAAAAVFRLLDHLEGMR